MNTTSLVQGEQYGNLIVDKLSYGMTSCGHRTCLVHCVCGQSYVIGHHRIRNRKPGCQKCHFGRPPQFPRGDARTGWKGCGEISGDFWSRLRKRGVKRAVGRVIEFTISLQEVWDIFLKQDRKCALSGVPLSFDTRKRSDARKAMTASLDRIDSSKGYIPGNVQWVHKTLNIAKQALPDADFIEWCRKVAAHNPAPVAPV